MAKPIRALQLIPILLGLFVFSAHAQQQPCNDPAYLQFDFWLGKWEVVKPDGTVAGTNRIEKEYGGCVLHERYVTPKGYTGESLNTYDPARKVWHQTWVDNTGLLLLLEGQFNGKSMVLEGTTSVANGKVTKHRITWTPNADRSVRQLWESTDAKGDWIVAFDGLYKPSAAQVTGPPAATGVTRPTLSNREMPEIRSPVSPRCGKRRNGDHIEYKNLYRKYEISQSAELLSLPQPELTPEAIEHNSTGKMIIEATLGPCGEISDIVLRGHVPFGLTERAIAATRKIKFKPATDNGVPVAQRIYLEYEFYLCNKAPICSRVTEVVQ